MQSLFEGRIDLADIDKGGASEADRENHFLTRALSAYALYVLGHVEVEAAASAVTDGGDDNGIDAIHYDEREKFLYIVQSKWIHSGKGEPANGDVKKFVSGIRDLFDQSFERFNVKLREKRALVNQALSDPGTRYKIILAYTGSDGLAIHSQRDFDDLAAEMNDTSEVVYITVLRQKELHSTLVSAVAGEPITLDITLSSWGWREEPLKAYYGQVSGLQIVDWWGRFGPQLFVKNLRGVLGDTEVNEKMRTTIETEPKHFWYFNNGVTLISNTVERSMAGGADRAQSTFRCIGVSVVNGAQTVSTIGKYADPGGALIDELNVQVRIISLQDSDASLGESITKTNNHQNRIESRDFVSQDTEQARIRNELAIDGIQYHLLRSEGVTRSDCSLDLVESTTALACAACDSGLAVQLKREIGKLWENIEKTEKTFYRTLFNPSVSGLRVWRCVQIQRLIDKTLDDLASELSEVGGRRYSVAIHGNRLIASLVFLDVPKRKSDDPNEKFDEYTSRDFVAPRVSNAHRTLFAAVEKEFPGCVIPTLFKNATKCKRLFEVCGGTPC